MQAPNEISPLNNDLLQYFFNPEKEELLNLILSEMKKTNFEEIQRAEENVIHRILDRIIVLACPSNRNKNFFQLIGDLIAYIANERKKAIKKITAENFAQLINIAIFFEKKIIDETTKSDIQTRLLLQKMAVLIIERNSVEDKEAYSALMDYLLGPKQVIQLDQKIPDVNIFYSLVKLKETIFSDYNNEELIQFNASDWRDFAEALFRFIDNDIPKYPKEISVYLSQILTGLWQEAENFPARDLLYKDFVMKVFFVQENINQFDKISENLIKEINQLMQKHCLYFREVKMENNPSKRNLINYISLFVHMANQTKKQDEEQLPLKQFLESKFIGQTPEIHQEFSNLRRELFGLSDPKSNRSENDKSLGIKGLKLIEDLRGKSLKEVIDYLKNDKALNISYSLNEHTDKAKYLGNLSDTHRVKELKNILKKLKNMLNEPCEDIKNNKI